MERTPEMQKFIEKVSAEVEDATDGFGRAFVDATGISPLEAQMVVATSISMGADGAVQINQQVWFERRRAA